MPTSTSIPRNQRVQWITITDLKVDPETQRSQRPAHAKQIAETFNAEAFGVLTVSERPDGYYVIDGQHRLAALHILGWTNQKVPCIVFSGLDQAEEAQRFIGLNTSKAVRTFDKFRLRVVAGEPIAFEIDAIVRKHGLYVADSARATGCVRAVRTLEDIYTGKLLRTDPNPDALDMTLGTVTRAWGTEPSALDAIVLGGIGAVYLRYGLGVDTMRMADKLTKIDGGAYAFLAKTRMRAGLSGLSKWASAAQLAIDLYNSGLRKDALPPFTK